MSYAAMSSPRAPLMSKSVLIGACLAAVIGLAVTRVHVRVQTTLVGYELGQLKDEEGRLLEEQSRLRMQLAKLTTRKHLSLMAEQEAPTDPAAPALAARH